MDRQQALLSYWFEGVDDARKVTPESPAGKRWWGGGPALDAEIARRFGDDLAAADRGEYEQWQETPAGALALVLLFDQIPRHVYRGKAEAFAFDSRAQAVTLRGLAEGTDEALGLYERAFFYMPLMHSERPDLHDRAEAAFSRLVALAGLRNLESRGYFEMALDYERKHRAIIDRFDRYPHRNAALGRESTPEEAEFLKEPGSSF